MQFREFEDKADSGEGQSTPFHDELFASGTTRKLNFNDTVAADSAKPVPTPIARTSDAGAAQSCPQSADYLQFIDTAARDMYDPASLGDVKKVEHEFDCDIHNTQDAIKFANKALSVSGDKYNQVLPPDEAALLQKDMNPDYVGIGVSLSDDSDPARKGSSEHGVTIENVLPGTPAANAGIRAGDKIVGVNSLTFGDEASSDAVIQALHGPEGEPVHITVERNGKKIKYNLSLGEIDAPTVTDKSLGNGIGYIAVSSFDDEKAASKFEVALKHQRKSQALIVDLRDNPGGLVGNALDMASDLLKSGTVITERARKDSDPDHPLYEIQKIELTPKREIDSTMIEGKPDSKQSVTGSRVPYLGKDRPVIILVNGNTASASEIFTGALHDNHAATVIGTQTYGKGIGQTLFDDMPGGSELKVTSFRYFTPNGTWLGDADKHRIGITPDMVVADTRKQTPDGEFVPSTAADASDDAQLAAATQYLQQQLAVKHKSH